MLKKVGQISILVRSQSCKGPSLPWKRARKEPKGQRKFLGPPSVIWNQISEIWPQKCQPGNPVLYYQSNNCRIATHALQQWFPTREEFLPREEFHEFRGGISTL